MHRKLNLLLYLHLICLNSLLGTTFKSESLGLLSSTALLNGFQYAQEFNEPQILNSGYQTLIEQSSQFTGASEHVDNLGYRYLNINGLDATRRIILRLNGWWVKNVYSGRVYWQVPTRMLRTIHYDMNGLVGQIELQPRHVSGFEIWGGYGSHHKFLLFAGAGIDRKNIKATLMAQIQLKDGPKNSLIPVEKVDDAGSAISVLGHLKTELHDELRNEWILDFLLLQQSRGGYLGPFDRIEPGSILSTLRWQSSLAWQIHPLDTLRLGTHLFVAQDFVNNQIMWAKNLEQREAYQTLHLRLSQTMEGLIGKATYIKSSIYWQGFGVRRGSYSLTSHHPNLENQSSHKQNIPCQPWGIVQEILGQCRVSAGAVLEIDSSPVSWLTLHGGMEFEANSDVAISPKNLFYPAAAASFQVTDAHRLWLSYRYAIRPPSLEQKYTNTGRIFSEFSSGQFFGNTKLYPERIHRGEIGWGLQDDIGDFFFQMELMGIIGYFMDPIDTLDHFGDVNFFENELAALQLAAQGTFKIHFTQKTNLYGDLSYNHITQLNTVALRAPKLIGILGSNIYIDTVGTIQVNLKMISQRQNNKRVPLEKLRTYTIPSEFKLDVYFTSDALWDTIHLEAGVFNIFDVKRKDPNMRPDRNPELIPRDGITFWVAIKII